MTQPDDPDTILGRCRRREEQREDRIAEWLESLEDSEREFRREFLNEPSPLEMDDDP